MGGQYFVYVLASRKNGTLYVGVTNDLVRRVYEHRNGLMEGFTKTYGVKRLVYYEATTEVEVAIAHEKSVKKWKRRWKIRLIEEFNPCWADLYEKLAACSGSPTKTFGDDTSRDFVS